ncbi:hypothetical protein PWY87_35695 [Kribbella solani]|uniref:hypothetical protein n=1 Tax=Kribbella solani TaxID=236067 RepID=UPI0029ABFE0F|nr:hypothetical protein [Kribbella solani]MDX3007061.1 hypothetical protein [Kribbella solani]
MSSARTLSGAVLAACLVAGLAGCGGQADKDKAAETPQTPLLPASAPPSSAKPTPKPVDPTTAAKTKIMADYKAYIADRSHGTVTNKPSYPYEKFMTGNALSALKSSVGGMYLIESKFGGSITFIKGRVAVINLKAKPATATVYACVIDDLTLTSKKGEVRKSGGIRLSNHDQVVLIGGRWKVTETQTNKPQDPGCA